VNVTGLNSIGLQGLQQQSAKPSSEKGGKPSSFGDMLGKAKSENNKTQDNKPQNSRAEDNKPDMAKSEAKPQAHEQKAGGDALPGQPAPPSLNGPLNDRILTGSPVSEPTLVNPGFKQKSLMPQEEDVDSLTRRVVWNDFLRKMKDEFGVSAEEVLSAFASLSDEELAQPPQATVDKVVAALGLTDQQSQMAKSYFTELVNKTHSRSMGEELEASHRQINLTLMSQREAQRKTLNRSLDQMNQDFFMKDPRAARPLNQSQNKDERGEMVEIGAPSLAAKGVKAPPAALDAFNSIPQDVPLAKPAAKNTVDEMIREFLAPQAKPQTLKAGEMTAAPMVSAQAAHAQAETAALASIAGGSAGSLNDLLADLSASMDSEEDGEFTSDASYLTAGLAGESKLGSITGPNPEFQAELAKAAKEPMDVSDLVDQAQIMVHEGGGEMKVTLTPEGLGEVAMRVSVNEGKVQVQMITESDEAKRLIERQLGELKGQLQNNNLQLETIKIDTASNLGKQLEQQYQDAQRQATHNAMAQFRQDTQGWRRSFFEQPSAKYFKGQGEAPRDIQAPTPSSRKHASRRLDLVA